MQMILHEATCPRRLLLRLACALACLSMTTLVGCSGPTADTKSPPTATPAPSAVEATAPPVTVTSEEVDRFCGSCHESPSPHLFPREGWPHEVQRGFDFARASDKKYQEPNFEAVVRYYQERAPESLTRLESTPPSTPFPFNLNRRAIPGPGADWVSATSFLALVRLDGSTAPALLVCDMAGGLVMVREPARSGQDAWRTLTDRIPFPAHAELADLDGDGHQDLLVADLGHPVPTDDLLGQVLWLPGRGDGTFEEPRTMLTGVGRVADARAADFDRDGDLDVIVAVFGYIRAGGIVLMQNQGPGTDGSLRFHPSTVDPRHGAIHLPVTDLDKDGQLDFIALISQEHEAVVAFLNRGGGKFEPHELFRADHPAFGSSGIDLLDLDGDADLDLLMSNGDVYDSPLIRPYHGVSWLENQGNLTFKPHHLGPLYGAHRAKAGDLDGDGDLDVVAASFLAGERYAKDRRETNADAVVIFEQTTPGSFKRHGLEWIDCDYPAIELGDLDDDGDVDLALGCFRGFDFLANRKLEPDDRTREAVIIWENRGASHPPSPSIGE